MKKVTTIEKDKHLEKLLQEVTKRVFDRYNDIEGRENQHNHLQATIQALHETTGISLNEIQTIASEVEQKFEIQPTPTEKQPVTHPEPAVVENILPDLGVSKYTFEELSEKVEKGLREFINHLVVYGIINVGLVVTNYLTSSFPWAIFPFFGWGVGLAAHYFEGVLWPRKDLIKKTRMVNNQIHFILSENWSKYRSGQRDDLFNAIYRLTVTEANRNTIEDYLVKVDPTISSQSANIIGVQIEALQNKFILKKPTFMDNIGKGIKKKLENTFS
jgi:hypothetical protein